MITFPTHSGCTVCPLHSECKSVGVPTRSHGSPEPPMSKALCIVGEAPGKEEDKEGRCWVGRSGQYLDYLIQHSKMYEVADIYLLNSCRCFPASTKTPAKKQIKLCRPYLYEDLSLIHTHYQGKVTLLLLGASACHSLLERTLQDSWALQGTDISLTLEDTTIFVPTYVSYHPAFLLRSPDKKFAAGQHWLRLRRDLSTGTRTSSPSIQYTVSTRPSWLPKG